MAYPENDNERTERNNDQIALWVSVAVLVVSIIHRDLTILYLFVVATAMWVFFRVFLPIDVSAKPAPNPASAEEKKSDVAKPSDCVMKLMKPESESSTETPADTKPEESKPKPESAPKHPPFNDAESTFIDACVWGDLEEIQQLYTPEITNRQDDHGWTPLVFAVQGGNLDAVKFLLDHGADPLIRANEGFTAYSLAQADIFEDKRQGLDYSRKMLDMMDAALNRRRENKA